MKSFVIIPAGRSPLERCHMYFRLILSVVVLCLVLVSTVLPARVGAVSRKSQISDLKSPKPARSVIQSGNEAEVRDPVLWRKALAIHRRAIVVDTHNDITTPMTNDDFDLAGPPPSPYKTNIERMKAGGLTAEFFSLYIRPWYVEHGGASRRTLDMIDSVYRAVERHPNDLMLATSAADIRRAKKQGKIAALM